MAKITFVIDRLPFFKNLGGVIDEALRRGHIVNLVHDVSQVGKIHKGVIRPSRELLPKFYHGKPNLVEYNQINELSNCVVPISDILVLHCGCVSDYETFMDKPNTFPYQYQTIRKAGIPVVSLHSHFYDNCLLKLNAYSSVDLTCVLSDYSLSLHKELLLEKNNLQEESKKVYQNQIEQIMHEKVIVTGSALFDLFDHFYHTKRQDSKKHDIVIFHLKFNQRYPFLDIFARHNSRLLSTGISLFYYKGKFLSKIFTYPRYRQILQRVERISNSNNLGIITKSRPKHGKYYEKLLQRISNKYITGEEDQYYPEFTSMQILQHAKFCLHIRTFSVMESVLAGVPSVHVQIPVNPLYKDKTAVLFMEKIRSCEPETIYNYSGCVWNVPWKDSLNFLDHINLNELEHDPERRAEYVKKYCGIAEQSASERQMDAIETLL